jgi:uncharacterized membrane protein (UPF0127 family)
MTDNRKTFCKLLLAVIFLILLFNISQKHNLTDIKQVKIAGQSIKVDLALTPGEQEQGLSGRSALKEDEGMLFVFQRSGRYPFWMKDMNFAIDIIWLSEDMKIVYIKKDARPEAYPDTYSSSEDAQYVLEVPSLFGDKNNLQIGDRVMFLYK